MYYQFVIWFGCNVYQISGWELFDNEVLYCYVLFIFVCEVYDSCLEWYVYVLIIDIVEGLCWEGWLLFFVV